MITRRMVPWMFDFSGGFSATAAETLRIEYSLTALPILIEPGFDFAIFKPRFNGLRLTSSTL